MQNTFAVFRGLLALFLLVGLATSCDLPVQPKFEFEPEIGELVTFEDQTVLEWMRSDASIGGNTNVNFDILVSAIEATGMEAEYSNSGDRRTFLMLNNEAFTGGGEIFSVLGVDAIDSLDATGIDRLRTILRYHIIDDYVDQGPEALPALLIHYFFQTLIPGEDGRISVNRDERFRMNINRADGLPGTARGTQVRQHNYVFSNGIGHHIRDYVRTRPY
ncbi:MAG: fasciclin domain-containing protein [Bacteroidota bacterium]